jgi:ribosome recycling factor
VSDDMMRMILSDADEKMRAAVEHTRSEFGKIRTGRANPGLITDLPVEYYGAKAPLQQLASVSVPEPRMLLISPFDQTAMKEIERTLAAADLNPSNDGQNIRVIFPELTEERRKEYVRLARERAEDGRIAIRNVRRAAKSDLADLEEEGEATEDDLHRADKALQDVTDKHVQMIDTLLANKEKELLEV